MAYNNSSYFKAKSDAFKRYENYKDSVRVGIISGLIVAITILVFNILKENVNIVLALLGGLIICLFLYYLFGIRSIERQKEGWLKFERSQSR